MSDHRWERIEAIFHRAAELAPEARATFLNEACGGDEALRQEVESLLAHDTGEGNTFAGPAEGDLRRGTMPQSIAESIPQSIAHYRISAKLGEGGMGTVYRATDTKLDRDVAIKVLPDAFADDLNRMSRFTREAKVLASLNHPNIAAIYGVEDRALVMELVMGQDLRGPLAVDTVLNYARQIAGALDAAHEKGIVHRDLKPANIRVTADGMVKLLDFGLAKFGGGADEAGAAPDSTSTGAHQTGTGVIMGTAAYMSPEQARGQTVDKRADIWAFGVVIYELLTGKMLFGGGGMNVSDSLTAVLTLDPDFQALPRDTPPRLRRVLERCLRKDPKLRLRDIGEVRILLDEPEPEAPAPARRGIPWTVAGVFAVALVSGAGWLGLRTKEPAGGAARFLLTLPPGTRGTSHIMSTHAVPSPDGRHLAIVVLDIASGKQTLWVRPLDSATAQRLDVGDEASLPFWSPDSKYIAFFAAARLKRIPVMGGSVQTICETRPTTDGGTWSADGAIVYANYGPTAPGLMRVPASGGAPVPLTALRDGELWHSWPQFLPGGRHLLFFAVNKHPEEGAIYVLEIGSGKRTLVLKNSTRGVWAAPGFLLFVREGTLYAQRMHATTFQLEGEPVEVAQDVAFNAPNGRNAIAVSQTGVLVYRGSASGMIRQLTWYSRDGTALGTASKPGDFISPTLSPDEKSVAISVGLSGRTDLWVMDLASGVLTRMTRDSLVSVAAAPIWSPDSKRVAISQVTGGIEQVELPSGKVTQLTKEASAAQAWWPDGRSILCTDDSRLSRLVLKDGAKLQPILDTPAPMQALQFSPDGQYVAYSSSDSGQSEIYVASFPAFAAKRKISSGGGRFPVWAKGGREILYRAADGALMSVAIRTGGNLPAGAPQFLFKTTGSDLGRFSVTADGSRFLINEIPPIREGEKPDIMVVLNWSAGLR